VKLGIPVTLITDSMVGSLFQRGGVTAVVVGTDRTAANGDVANKIGTYQIASWPNATASVLCRGTDIIDRPGVRGRLCHPDRGA